jgi:hypothetical protein
VFFCLKNAVLDVLPCSGSAQTPDFPSAPPWSLGEQPNFSGIIEYWAKGDAIAPADGGFFATMYGAGDPEGTTVGVGTIKADGSFKFGLYKEAYSVAGGLPPAQVLCSGLSASNPQQKIANIDVMEVLALYVNDQHARPGGGILISTAHPVPAAKAVFTFMYANQDGTLRGSCNMPDVGNVAFDLDLRRGWNSLSRDPSGFRTAAIPAGAKWYFINPLTAANP